MTAWYDSLAAMRICKAMFDVSAIAAEFDPQSACAATREAANLLGGVKIVWAKGFDGIRETEGREWQVHGVCEDLRRQLEYLQMQWMEQQMIARGFRKEFLMDPPPRNDVRAAAGEILANTPDVGQALSAFAERRHAVRSAAA